jgi:transposase
MLFLCLGGGRGEPLKKKYIVKLTDAEQSELVTLTRKGRSSARKLNRVMILLAADEGAKDEDIAVRVRVTTNTVAAIRRRFVEEGLEAAINERPRPGKARLLDGHQEVYLIALTGSAPPAGRAQWTMQLLADELVGRRIVASISDETVRQTLKRGISNPGSARNGASRP